MVGSISKSDIIGEWKINYVVGSDFVGDYLSIKEDGSFYYRRTRNINGKECIAGYNEGYYKINGDLIYFFSTNKCGVFFANYDNKNIIASPLRYFELYEEKEVGRYGTKSSLTVFEK